MCGASANTPNSGDISHARTPLACASEIIAFIEPLAVSVGEPALELHMASVCEPTKI